MGFVKAILKALLVLLLLVIVVVGFSYFYYSFGVRLPENEGDFVAIDQMPTYLVEKFRIKGNSTYYLSKLLSSDLSQHESGFSWHWKMLMRTLWVKLNLSEDKQILYQLNMSYAGGGCNGVECASKKCFGKSLNLLENSEIDLLLTLLASPSRYSHICSTKLNQKL